MVRSHTHQPHSHSVRSAWWWQLFTSRLIPALALSCFVLALQADQRWWLSAGVLEVVGLLALTSMHNSRITAIASRERAYVCAALSVRRHAEQLALSVRRPPRRHGRAIGSARRPR